jgi:hypothetical protein
MHDQEESREEWEKELVDIQRGVTFEEGLRRTQIITKRLSATTAPIPDFSHLVMLLLSAVFLAITFFVFSSDIPHKITVGVASLAVSCCLGVAAIRLGNQHR